MSRIAKLNLRYVLVLAAVCFLCVLTNPIFFFSGIVLSNSGYRRLFARSHLNAALRS